MRSWSKNLIVSVFIFLPVHLAQSQNGPGAWYMYFGQYRLHDRMGLHVDVQTRKYDVIRHPQQVLLRPGIRFYSNNSLSLAAGYAKILNYTEQEPYSDPVSNEDRIWQEVFYKHSLKRFYFIHRLRLEQRFLHHAHYDEYANRCRYMFRTNITLNKNRMEKNTWFAGLYDEVFLNFKSSVFDRNRLYLAVGYRFNSMADIQTGILWQTVGARTNAYLQLMLNWDIDFRTE